MNDFGQSKCLNLAPLKWYNSERKEGLKVGILSVDKPKGIRQENEGAKQALKSLGIRSIKMRAMSRKY